LVHKARWYGLDPLAVSWIEDFLTDRSQQVVVEGQYSSSALVTSGVVLGPLLFLLYIKDLPECVQSTARLIANDWLLYRVIHKDQDQAQLQKDIDHLQSWEADWLMDFNPDTCKWEVLQITYKRSLRAHDYTIRIHKLRFELSGKYVGVTIDSKLTFNHHVDTTCREANGTLALLRRYISSSVCHSCPLHLCVRQTPTPTGTLQGLRPSSGELPGSPLVTMGRQASSSAYSRSLNGPHWNSGGKRLYWWCPSGWYTS
jgi:hypothetical protein